MAFRSLWYACNLLHGHTNPSRASHHTSFFHECLYRDYVFQLAEFLGLAPAKISAHMATTAAQNMQRAAEKVGAALSPKSLASKLKSVDRNYEECCPPWISSRIYGLCRKVCWELTFSIDPFELFKTIRGIKHQEDKLCSLFCFSAWMAPVIPDYADIGAYSMATKARIYRKAAERMPKLILEASFGEPASLRTMQVRPAHNVGSADCCVQY